jgi:hypothetical protein
VTLPLLIQPLIPIYIFSFTKRIHQRSDITPSRRVKRALEPHSFSLRYSNFPPAHPQPQLTPTDRFDLYLIVKRWMLARSIGKRIEDLSQPHSFRSIEFVKPNERAIVRTVA